MFSQAGLRHSHLPFIMLVEYVILSGADAQMAGLLQFYFIRHGQSVNNLIWDNTGSSEGRNEDPGLTETGRQQVGILARFLKQTDPTIVVKGRDDQNRAGFGITHLYTSLMVRAVATGTVVARALGLPLVAWEDLHETGGIYLGNEATGDHVGQPGKNRAYFETHYPDLVLPDSLGADGWWNRPFEEREQSSARAERFLLELLARHSGKEDRVAVISHGGFYNVLLRSLLKIQREDSWFALNNVAITRIDFHAQGIDAVYMNRADFVPKELLT